MLPFKLFLAFFVGLNFSSGLINGQLWPPIPILEPKCDGTFDLIPAPQPGDCLALPVISPILCLPILQLDTNVAAIDKTTITVSGFSSGASQTIQFHNSHSSFIKGVGIFAGSPYLAAKESDLPAGSFGGGLNFLESLATSSISQINVTKLEQMAIEASNQGKIDPISNIAGSKVYIFAGELDLFMPPAFGKKIAEMYRYFGANVQETYLSNANHVMPTKCFGGPCAVFDIVSDAVNRCNYSGVFEMFEYLYGPNFIRPADEVTPKLTGKYYSFDQTPFCQGEFKPQNCFMQNNGYIYVPECCQNVNNTCRLHVAKHGCFESGYSALATNAYAKYTGYAQSADKNCMIVVFPQSAFAYVNVERTNYACWDYFGGTTEDYPYKASPQTQTVLKIISAIAKL